MNIGDLVGKYLVFELVYETKILRVDGYRGTLVHGPSVSHNGNRAEVLSCDSVTIFSERSDYKVMDYDEAARFWAETCADMAEKDRILNLGLWATMGGCRWPQPCASP